jgi:soluble lytic murein transglycosylase-like protein
MRGAPKKLSRLHAAPASLAAAALIAFSTVFATAASAKPSAIGSGSGSDIPLSTANAGADGNSFAYAVPRNAPSPSDEIILPQPLPPSAVAQYQRILSLQEEGAYGEADQLIARLNDTTLVGAVLAERYLSPNYHSTPAELLAWYNQYASQPAAPAIYQLMQKKLPAAKLPAAPQTALLPEATSIPAASGKPAIPNDVPAWCRAFNAGLADWQKGDVAAAEPLFIQAANISYASDADRAAGAFWAARAALRLQQPVDYLNWLRTANLAPTSFYGMIAGRLLGQGFGPTGIAASLTEADITAVDAVPAGHLAFALLQVGETEQAGLALRAMWPQIQADPALAHSVEAVAARAGIVDVAIAIAGQTNDTGNEIAGVSLPLPALHPAGGFSIDPALVYALTRTESGFNEHAVSPVGARGLMQLMPVTASFVARNEGVPAAVDNPSENLALGQDYIRYLGEQVGIDDNLLAILASYNAGPGAAAAWYNALKDDSDPLMFIETIPNDQTRHFVHQVLADSWIYAEEIGLKPESLDDIAQGNFPQLRDMPDLTASN